VIELPDEPMYGLIAFTEFWARFDYPDDSPHVVQGQNNCITPQEYYTKQNYDDMIIRHKNWLKSKLEYVMGARGDEGTELVLMG